MAVSTSNSSSCRMPFDRLRIFNEKKKTVFFLRQNSYRYSYRMAISGPIFVILCMINGTMDNVCAVTLRMSHHPYTEHCIAFSPSGSVRWRATEILLFILFDDIIFLFLFFFYFVSRGSFKLIPVEHIFTTFLLLLLLAEWMAVLVILIFIHFSHRIHR